MKSKILNFKVLLAGIWLVFTFSLAGWWLIFALSQVERFKGIAQTEKLEVIDDEILRQQKMILWEGGILLISLLGGGSALLYYVLQERRQNKKLKEFFGTFSHELKTSITSLRLQAESLQEDFKSSPLLERLLNDTVRLQIQLENSLFLANIEKSQVYIQELDLEEVVDRFREHWPEAKIELEKKAFVQADARAFEGVLKNLIQNAIVHGKATKITISPEAKGSQLLMTLRDNGEGFKGDVSKLGKAFHRHSETSGSGLGLYLVQQLMKRMSGKASFENSQGFAVKLKISGRLG